jgi:hypothetical protein
MAFLLFVPEYGAVLGGGNNIRTKDENSKEKSG